MFNLTQVFHSLSSGIRCLTGHSRDLVQLRIARLLGSDSSDLPPLEHKVAAAAPAIVIMFHISFSTRKEKQGQIIFPIKGSLCPNVKIFSVSTI